VTRIPIDLAAPIACTATADEIPLRIDQITQMREELRSVDRTDTGLLLHFDRDADLEGHLEQFVRDEKGCCQFWGFQLEATIDAVSLAWDGPPDVQAFLDQLTEFFRSDQPLTAFSGLL
jgi:hypothetical protein